MSRAKRNKIKATKEKRAAENGQELRSVTVSSENGKNAERAKIIAALIENCPNGENAVAQNTGVALVSVSKELLQGLFEIVCPNILAPEETEAKKFAASVAETIKKSNTVIFQFYK